MSTATSSSDALRGVFRQPTGGIAVLVDGLLTTCRDHGLRLDWQAGRFRVRSFAEDWQELPDLPLRKSVFRAVLARLAVLCNERHPGSCSPYGGQGEIAVGTNPTTVFRVAFTNTPGEQRLVMSAPLASDLPEHPMLARLLDEVPRLRRDLKGWVKGHLVPALDRFPEAASDAQIDTALVNLRQVLRARADDDPWLGDIADLGTGEYAGPLKRMTPDSALPQRVPLPPGRVSNRTIVEQARRLSEALTAAPAKAAPPPSPPPQPRQDAK
jgi:hypothetical protein